MSQTRIKAEQARIPITYSNLNGAILTNPTVTSSVPLSNCAPLPATSTLSADGLTITSTATLTSGDSESFTCDAPAPSTGPYTATITVTGTDPAGNFVHDNTTARVELLDIALSKTTAPDVARGQDTNWELTVHNTGSVAINATQITDLLVADCTQTVGPLAAAAQITLQCRSINTQQGIENTANVVTETRSSGGLSAQSTATATVRVTDVTVTKTVSEATKPVGETVIFTVSATNTGEVPLSNVTVSDEHYADCSFTLASLPVGETHTQTCTHILNHADTELFTSAVSVSGFSPNNTQVTDSDQASVRALVNNPVVPDTNQPDEKPAEMPVVAHTESQDKLAITGAALQLQLIVGSITLALLVTGLIIAIGTHRARKNTSES